MLVLHRLRTFFLVALGKTERWMQLVNEMHARTDSPLPAAYR